MTFLKKLGQILATVASTALGIGPLVAPLFGAKGSQVAGEISTVVNDLTAVGGVIVQVETIGASMTGMTGPQKLQAATALVKPILLTSQLISGKHIADAALLDKAVTEITQGVVDMLNAVDQKSTSTEVKV